jgi:hypothetical protein
MTQLWELIGDDEVVTMGMGADRKVEPVGASF